MIYSAIEKYKTALEGSICCVLGMPGPCEHAEGRMLMHDVAWSEAGRPALSAYMQITNVPYFIKTVERSIENRGIYK